MARPEYVTAYLDRIGRLDADGIGRLGRAGRCASCSALVVRALDGDVAAVPCTLDLAALTPIGELTALLHARMTYNAYYSLAAWHIHYRNARQIKHSPAGSNSLFIVMADHECHAMTLASYPITAKPANIDLIDPPY